ncbi:MAG: efflux RND transporter periplasmic adaptor subunit [Planctomycetota bacterium]
MSLTFWWPRLSRLIDNASGKSSASSAADVHDHETEHDHAHAGHSDGESLELSDVAMKNLGLTAQYLKPLEVSSFRRTITIPAVVVTKPGRTQIEVSAPLTGMVTHVHAVTGESVVPGTMLFEVRLTHEELVTAQTEFLKTLGELEVEKVEIARLETAAESGAIAGRTLLERKYSRDKLEALIRAQREALRLHGLSDRHIEEIERERRLLRSLQIVAPSIDTHDHLEELHLSGRSVQPVSHGQTGSTHVKGAETPDDDQLPDLVIERLSVRKGQSVTAGETLCVVADLKSLYIEGQAFDQDAPAINLAASKNWPLTAVFPGADGESMVSDLTLSFVASEVDRESRALGFYIDLPNIVLGEKKNREGQRFLSWKYRPGQRLQLLVPVEEWPAEMIVPIDAVARDGVDWFVFRRNGKRFDRVPVHVRYRDQANVVIANDGAVFPGDVIALRSAHQMQMAIRNKSGAGADPHAGHSH